MEPHFPYDPRPDRLDAVLAPRHYTEAEQAGVASAREHLAGAFAARGWRTPTTWTSCATSTWRRSRASTQALHELFDGLTARGVLAHAVVVIAADHGEEFHEHGVVGHGLDLYNETLQVPLLLLAPGRPPAVADESVSLIDVAPTILDLIGAPAEPSFEGRSLVRPGAREPPYAELLVNAARQGAAAESRARSTARAS